MVLTASLTLRQAAEKSLAILRSSPEQATASLASGGFVIHTSPPLSCLVSYVEDGAQSDDLLRPVFMGCATKNAKVVAISLGSLQRLIALKAVPQSAVPLIINTMSDAMSQGVDIQLRILQTLVSLITNFPSVHAELLGEVCCYALKSDTTRPSNVIYRHFFCVSSCKTLGLRSCRPPLLLRFVNWLCLLWTRWSKKTSEIR